MLLYSNCSKEEDKAVINKCLEEAIADNKLTAAISFLKNGAPIKKDIIENILNTQQISLSFRDRIYGSWKKIRGIV